MGPGPGELGGEVVFQGTFKDMLLSRKSKTAPYMTGDKKLPESVYNIAQKKMFLQVKGAQ